MSIEECAMGDGTPCNCHRCGMDLNVNDTEWQERLEINYRVGYGSVFGDENLVRCTLCQRCVKTALGEWLEVLEDDPTHRVREGQPKGAYQPYQLKRF